MEGEDGAEEGVQSRVIFMWPTPEQKKLMMAKWKNLTDDQFYVLCNLEDMERKWRRILPRHSEVEWLHIFPQARDRWAPIIRARMKRERVMLETDHKIVESETVRSLLANKYPWRDDLIKEHGRRQLGIIESRIRAIDGRLAYLKQLMGKGVTSKNVTINEGMIAHAKEYPIEQLVEVNRAKFAQCIWHKDTKPSMYCKNNFAHCYSCGKSGDTIAIVMQKEGLTFRQAVMRLQ